MTARRRWRRLLVVALLGALAFAALTVPAVAGADTTTTVAAPAPVSGSPTTPAGGTSTGVTSTNGTTTTVTPNYGFSYRQLTPYSAQPVRRGALESDGQSPRYTVGGTWLYRPDPSNIGQSEGYWRDTPNTSGWNEVAIPNAWNAGQYTSAGFAGTVGWYRRDFTLPADAFAAYVPKAARSWLIEFESVNYDAEVWLNGHELGTHQGAYLPFDFAARYMRAGVNRLVVRIDDTHTPTTFPPGPASGWWNFGGILDAVYLHPVQEANLDSATIRPVLSCPTCSATIEESATVQNLSARPETVRLRGTYGSLKLAFGTQTIAPGRTWSPTAQVTLAHPKLWAPGSPNLYSAKLTLTDTRGHVLGGYSYLSGVRQITWQNGLLFLNGHQLHLRGVSIHEQTVQSGAALDPAQQAQLLSWAEQLGANIVREHYPLDPEAEEMADKAGLLLWSEIPVYDSLQSTALDNQDLASATWRKSALALLADNIDTNQNHPAILLWSVANEMPAAVSANEATYIAAAAAEVHSLDPTRPAALATVDYPGLPCQAAGFAPLDVIGINEYFGWFDENSGATEDRQALLPFLDSVRACYPHQALMVTEWGFGANRDGPTEVRGTYGYQGDNVTYSDTVFNSLSWLSGAIYFPMQDFAAQPGYTGGEPLGMAPFVDKGVIDQYGNEKPGFATMQGLFRGFSQIAPARRPR